MPPLGGYLFVSAALFSIGLYGTLARRNAVAILMGIELMLNAAALNFVAFWRHVNPAATLAGQTFTIFIITLAAAEVAVGLALIIAIYRNRNTVVVDDVDMLKG